MAKRKKHMKLPNGFGSVRYLGKGRRRPYGAYPPVTEYTDDGRAIQPKAIGYAEDWYGAYDMLVAWRNDLELPQMQAMQSSKKGPTFAEVYERYFDDKYNSKKKYSESSKGSTRAAFNNSHALHNCEFSKLRYEDLQNVIDSCELKRSSLCLIVSLFHQMYAYAEKYDLCEKDYSKHVSIKIENDTEHGVPFSAEELAVLWRHSDDETAQTILIMIYSGFRIAAFKSLYIDLQEGYFRGGVKTSAGKDRIVPIHSGIHQFVSKKIELYNQIIPIRTDLFRAEMRGYLKSIGISDHTPHDCRHTFSALCEEYKVNENDRKRLLGHAFKDVTNKVYGHRTLEQLRTEIEKIKICY